MLERYSELIIQIFTSFELTIIHKKLLEKYELFYGFLYDSQIKTRFNIDGRTFNE